MDFWNYDPSDKGWYIYGKGSVSANGKQVIPDPDVRVWEFTGAMISGDRRTTQRAGSTVRAPTPATPWTSHRTVRLPTHRPGRARLADAGLAHPHLPPGRK